MDKCLGLYCGRMKFNNSVWDACGACSSGFRADINSKCRKCSSNPNIYQWLYLGFMAMLPIIKQGIWILEKYENGRKEALIQLLSCLFENLFAIIATILLFEPIGKLYLICCDTDKLSDWYTVFYNPKINHTQVVHCAQEAVYPFYSVIFVMYLVSLILMLSIRVWFSNILIKSSSHRKQRTNVLYKTMYLYPILAAIHGIGAGLIFYSYPYLIVLSSIFGLVHYSVKQNILSLKKIFTGSKCYQHFIFIICHFSTLAYSILAIGSGFDPTLQTLNENLPFLAFVPVPLVFMVLTESFSRPDKIEKETVGNII